jgi:hypothetical protein
MSTDKALREHVLVLLNGAEAHGDFDEIVAAIPDGVRGARPAPDARSPWEVLEHLRIALRDILEFTRNPNHVSPDFPEGYWPKSPEPPDDGAWERSADAFRADMRALSALVEDESMDLFAPIPHGDGQTLLREALLAADHNAYHLGQLALLQDALGR